MNRTILPQRNPASIILLKWQSMIATSLITRGHAAQLPLLSQVSEAKVQGMATALKT